MAKKLSKLNKQHFRAMKLRLQGATYKQIAQQLGKSERAVVSWFCEDELFRKEFTRLQEETLEQARSILLSYAPEAAINLIRLAKGEERGRGTKTMLDANIDILNRVGLKPTEKQEIQHTGKDGGPLQVEFIAEWGGNETQD